MSDATSDIFPKETLLVDPAAEAALIDDQAVAPSLLLRGRLLRTCREQAGLSLTYVGEQVGVAWQTWQGWENARRGTDLVRARGMRDAVAEFGYLVGSPDAVLDLWKAIGSVDALTARGEWAINFTPPGMPCWVWLRSATATVADLRWGLALHGRVDVPAGRGGVIVQFPTSVRNPPLEVGLSAPGWVDHGLGQISELMVQAVGSQVVSAQQAHRAHRRARTAWLRDHLPSLSVPGRQMRQLARDFGVRWHLIVPHLADVLLPAPTHALDVRELVPIASSVSTTAQRDQDNLVVRKLLMSPQQMQLLRRARGFAQEELATAASSGRYGAVATPRMLAPAPLNRSAVQRLETEQRLPRAALTMARLDMLLGADGRLGVERTFDSEEMFGTDVGRNIVRHTIYFPFWWVGPVWLQAVRPGQRVATAQARLEWGPWRRGHVWSSGELVTTRQAPPAPGTQQLPLEVSLPRRWRLLAGLGAVSTATDIGASWRPRNLEAMWQATAEAMAAVKAARQLQQG